MIKFFHNPDYITTVSKAARWWTFMHTEVTLNDLGYDGTRAYTASNAASYMTKVLRVQDSETFNVGLRFKVTSLPSSAKLLLGVIEEDGELQCLVALNPSGTLSIYSGASTELAESVNTVSTDEWHRLGLRGFISKSVGRAEVHLDSTATVENVVVRVDNADTSPSDHRAAQGIYVGVAPGILVGHIYYVDGYGVDNLLIHGARVRHGMPIVDGEGRLTDWTANTGARNAAIDDADPDDDVTYIYGSIVGDEFSAFMGPIDETATAIRAAQLTALTKNTTGSTVTASLDLLLVPDAGSPHYAGWQSATNEGWRAIHYVWPRNPRSNDPWSVDKVNETEWGGRMLG